MKAHSRWLFLALGGAALTEFMLLRFVLRMGPELPTGAAVEDALSAAYRAGLWTLNLAGMLCVLGLGAMVLDAVRERRQGSLAQAAVLTAATVFVLAAWAYAATGGSQAMLMAQVLGVPAAMVVCFMSVPMPAWQRAWMSLFTVAYVAAGLQFATRSAGAGEATAWLLTVAESAAVAAALSSPLVFNKLRRPSETATARGLHSLAVAAATGAALFYTAFALFEPTIAKYFVMWDSGFASATPWPVQAVAIWALVYAVTSALPRQAAVGLLLVALAGIRLEYTYFSLLALTGFALLTASARDFATAVPALARRSLQPEGNPVSAG